jgi:hypothetical protein
MAGTLTSGDRDNDRGRAHPSSLAETATNHTANTRPMTPPIVCPSMDASGLAKMDVAVRLPANIPKVAPNPPMSMAMTVTTTMKSTSY